MSCLDADPLFEEKPITGHVWVEVNGGYAIWIAIVNDWKPSYWVIDSGGMPDGQNVGCIAGRSLICFLHFEGSQTNLYQSLDETAVMLLVDWEGEHLLR